MSQPSRIAQVLAFVAQNFSVPVLFFVVFRLAGAQAAVATALIGTLIEAIILRARRGRVPPFFLVISFFTLLFGSIDLALKVPNYYRFEPFAQSALVGTLLWLAVLLKIPIARWLADDLPPEYRPDESRLPKGYLSRILLVFAAYFYLKAITYLWLSRVLDLGTLMLVRPFVGNGSFIALLLAEVAYRKRVARRHLDTQRSPPAA